MVEHFQYFMCLALGALGLLVIAILLFSYKSNILVNVYLIIIFFIVSLRFIDIGILGFYKFHIITGELVFIKPALLIGAASFYLYFEALFNNPKFFKVKTLRHFIIPILVVVFNVLQNTFPEYQNNYTQNAIHIGIFIFILFYILKTGYLLHENLYKKEVEITTSFKHFNLIKKWSLFFYSISIFLCIRLLYSFFMDIEKNESINGYDFPLLIIVLWFIIFAKIITSPEILFGYPKLKHELSKFNEKLDVLNEIWNLSSPQITNLQDATLEKNIRTKIKIYAITIDDFVKTNVPFRCNSYSIKNLAKALNLPPSHLAYVFKYHSALSFVEFRQYCRINDALNLINTGFLNTKTFEALATKVGFASYNSFFLSFKKYTQRSPKDYIQEKTIS